MTLLQIAVNLVLAIIAFVLVGMLLNALGVGGALNTVVSLLAAVGVFFANFAARIRA